MLFQNAFALLEKDLNMNVAEALVLVHSKKEVLAERAALVLSLLSDPANRSFDCMKNLKEDDLLQLVDVMTKGNTFISLNVLKMIGNIAFKQARHHQLGEIHGFEKLDVVPINCVDFFCSSWKSMTYANHQDFFLESLIVLGNLAFTRMEVCDSIVSSGVFKLFLDAVCDDAGTMSPVIRNNMIHAVVNCMQKSRTSVEVFHQMNMVVKFVTHLKVLDNHLDISLVILLLAHVICDNAVLCEQFKTMGGVDLLVSFLNAHDHRIQQSAIHGLNCMLKSSCNARTKEGIYGQMNRSYGLPLIVCLIGHSHFKVGCAARAFLKDYQVHVPLQDAIKTTIEQGCIPILYVYSASTNIEVQDCAKQYLDWISTGLEKPTVASLARSLQSFGNQTLQRNIGLGFLILSKSSQMVRDIFVYGNGSSFFLSLMDSESTRDVILIFLKAIIQLMGPQDKDKYEGFKEPVIPSFLSSFEASIQANSFPMLQQHLLFLITHLPHVLTSSTNARTILLELLCQLLRQLFDSIPIIAFQRSHHQQ